MFSVLETTVSSVHERIGHLTELNEEEISNNFTSLEVFLISDVSLEVRDVSLDLNDMKSSVLFNLFLKSIDILDDGQPLLQSVNIRLDLMALSKSFRKVSGYKRQISNSFGNFTVEKISQGALNVVLDLVGIYEAFRKINKVTLIRNTIHDT